MYPVGVVVASNSFTSSPTQAHNLEASARPKYEYPSLVSGALLGNQPIRPPIVHSTISGYLMQDNFLKGGTFLR